MSFKVKLCNSNNVALFVSICSEYDSYIDYAIDRYIIDAKSIMGVLSTRLDQVATVTIDSENKREIDSFKDNISLWIVEE